MGAKNISAAFGLYAGKVPFKSFAVLVWMANVALDGDAEPWWSQGHDALARHALGRPEPVTPNGAKADERAVRAAITPLFGAGAITTARRSSGHGEHGIHVRYRLWLTKPAPDDQRRPEHRSAQDENRPVDNDMAPDGNRPTQSVGVGRKASPRRTESVAAQDGKRPPKEYEEDEELLNGEEQTGDRRTPRTGSALSRTAPWKIDFSGGEADRADPEAERRRQMDALMAFDRTTPGASP